MRKTNLWILPLGIIALFPWGDAAWGYGETHKFINDVVYDESILDEYFNGQLEVTLDEGRIK